MEAVLKLKDNGKCSTITSVVYQMDSLQDEELKKVETMAKSAGLNTKAVPNWFESELENGKNPKPGYELLDIGE
ncbi:hypothetical protein ACE6H2_018390 [Prunus campanulata]